MQLGHTLVIRPGALGDAVLTFPVLHMLRLSGASSLTILGTPSSWGFIKKSHHGLRISDFSSQQWLGLFAPSAKLGDPARAMLAQIQTAIVYLAGDSMDVVKVLQVAGVQTVLCIEPPTLLTHAQAPSHHPAFDPLALTHALEGGVVPLSPCADIGLRTPDSNSHASERLLDPLSCLISQTHRDRALAHNEQSSDVFLSINEQEQVRALDKLGFDAPPESGFLAIHPGSGGRDKCWPADRFAKLAVEFSCRHGIIPLVFFGPADDSTRGGFESAMPPGVEWESMDGWPLRDVLALLSLSKAYIGNDSGITHLAARACPVLALFGPTDPAVWAPLGKNVHVLQAAHHDIKNLSMAEVIEAAEKCLSIQRNSRTTEA